MIITPDLHNVSRYRTIRQHYMDWLKAEGVPVLPHMLHPTPLRQATGTVTEPPRRFMPTSDGEEWLVFQEPGDVVCWNPESGDLTTAYGAIFALGEANIVNPGTYALGSSLVVCDNVLDWLRDRRRGIVVLDWLQAFDRLRDCPRISIPESLVETYRRHMRPTHMPNVVVRPGGRMAA